MNKGDSTIKGVYLGYGFSSCGFIFGATNANNGPCDTQKSSDINQWHHLTGVLSSGTRTLL